MRRKRALWLSVGALVAAAIITAFLSLRGMMWEYDTVKINTLVDSIAANPTPGKIKRLLAYPENHYADGVFSLHYVACLWWIEQKRPGVLANYRTDRSAPFLNEVTAGGAAAFADYYSKGRK